MEAITPPAHYYLAPSSSSRWLRCPGSLAAPPDDGGEAAEFGTAGHAWAYARLTGQPVPDDIITQIAGYSPERREVLRDFVSFCVEHVFDLPYPIKEYELKIQSNMIEEHGGTIDVIAADEDTLHVVDYKFGRIYVKAESNTQLACYLVLAAQRYPGRKKFKGTIVQPVLGSIETAEFTPAQLDATMAGVMRASITTHRKAGDHCAYCPLGASCLNLAQYVRDVAEDFADLPLEDPLHPTAEDLERTGKAAVVYSIACDMLKRSRELLKAWGQMGEVLTYGFSCGTTTRHKLKPDAGERLLEMGLTPSQVYKLASATAIAKALGVKSSQLQKENPELFDKLETSILRRGPSTPDDFSEFDDLTTEDEEA